MTNQRCRAENPETCRYHRPGAGQHAQTMLKKAEQDFRKATTFTNKEDAETRMFIARSIYDATDEGYQALRNLMREDRSYPVMMRYKYAKLARAEEKQDGPAGTDAIFLTRDTMETKLKSLEKTVTDGNSDQFLDTWDMYKKDLRIAVQEENSYHFTTAYNSLVEKLTQQGTETQWFDQTKQQNWVRSIKKHAITGRVFRSHTTLDNLHASLTFDA